MEHLKQDLLVSSIMIPTDDVIKVQWEDAIAPVIETMVNKDISHILVVNQLGLVEGIFSDNTLSYVLAQRGSLDNIDEWSFENVKEFIALEQVCLPRFYDFVPETMSLTNARNEFKLDMADRLELLIITDNGKRTGQLKGLVTPWDLI